MEPYNYIWFHAIPCMEPYDSMRFHARNHMIPCDSMHGNGMKLSYGTIWFHAIPCTEPYDSVRFHAWKRHEIIVWNHMVPCMESHGRLMNLDPGTAQNRIRFVIIICFTTAVRSYIILEYKKRSQNGTFWTHCSFDSAQNMIEKTRKNKELFCKKIAEKPESEAPWPCIIYYFIRNKKN